MSKMAGLKMAAAAVVVGGGLYATLEVLRPYHHPEVKLDGLVPAEAVFGDQAQVASGAAATEATPAPAIAAPAPAPKPTAGLAAVPASKPDSALATKPTPVDAKPAVPKPVTPATEKPVAPTVVAAAPASAAQPVASKPAAKPAAPTQAPASKPPTVSPIAWWQGSGTATGLSVSYAGSAAFKRALVVMTNGSFDNPAAPNRSIKVLGADGKAVAGSWEINAANPGMLVFPVSSNGVYQLVIGADLSDRQNRQLGRIAQGPIEVR